MNPLIHHLPLLAVSSWIEPLWRVAVAAAIALALLLGTYFALTLVLPKVAAVARTTAKEAILQPIFWVLLIFGSGLILLFIILPYNTFGEDIKMFKDTGLTLIMLLSIILALWTASVSIAEEIEGRTALTLLSKPISRREFVIGKFLGIIGPVTLMFILLGIVFLCSTSAKVPYDARENSLPTPIAKDCAEAMMTTIPGLVLAWLEAIVLASISVAISTRLQKQANLVICATVYALGHLGPLLVQSAVGKDPIVRFVGTLIATVLPVLDHFNIQAAVSAGVPVPNEYLAWAALYCLIYSTVMILIALALFENRDLA
jgi:ABC-type transport system involved in multi-copper enzyme maturation permease subunit